MERPEPDCVHCRRRPRGYVTDAGTMDAFPDTWEPLAGHPDFRPVPWIAEQKTGWVFCRACQAVWYLFYDPKDLYYSDILPLPKTSWAVLSRDSAVEDVMAFVFDGPEVAGGRFFENWISRWLSRIEFDHREALEWLLSEMSRSKLSVESARRLVVYARAVIDRRDAAAGVQDVDFGPIADLTMRADFFGELSPEDRTRAEKSLREALVAFRSAAARRTIDLGAEVDRKLDEATSRSILLDQALARLTDAIKSGDDDQLAEVMHREYLVLEENLVGDDDTAAIHHLRPLIWAIDRLKASAEAAANPHRFVPRAVSRYQYILRILVERGEIARPNILEVLEAYAPHRVSFYRPDHFDTIPSAAAIGCRRCRLSSLPGNANGYGQFPNPWTNIYEHADFSPGGWVASGKKDRIHFCGSCGVFLFSYLDVDGRAYRHQRLPASCSAVINAQATAEEVVGFVVSPVYAAHRLVALRRICWCYFEQSYGAPDAADLLLERVDDEGLTDDQRLDMLRFFDLTMRVIAVWNTNYSGKQYQLPEGWSTQLQSLCARDWASSEAVKTVVEIISQVCATAEQAQRKNSF